MSKYAWVGWVSLIVGGFILCGYLTSDLPHTCCIPTPSPSNPFPMSHGTTLWNWVIDFHFPEIIISTVMIVIGIIQIRKQKRNVPTFDTEN
jgi:hypothetical protein